VSDDAAVTLEYCKTQNAEGLACYATCGYCPVRGEIGRPWFDVSTGKHACWACARRKWPRAVALVELTR
jgi:hypothetical protein